MPGSSTPALGVDVGLQYSRLGAGLMVLGGHGTDTLGTVTLVAIAGTASYDVLELGASVTVRVAGELGVAMGIPAPNESSVGHAKVAPHAALQGGLAASLPLGAGYDLQGFIGGGYGTSLNAEADGRRVASLGGGILSITAGVRFP
jgi:hypothetical protein